MQSLCVPQKAKPVEGKTREWQGDNGTVIERKQRQQNDRRIEKNEVENSVSQEAFGRFAGHYGESSSLSLLETVY